MRENGRFFAIFRDNFLYTTASNWLRSHNLRPLAVLLAIDPEMRELGADAAQEGRPSRAVAQLGRAPGSGPGGRGFKSHQPDEE